MSFLTLSNGSFPSGSEEASFTSNFRIVPNNSRLLATINSFDKKVGSNGIWWQVSWEIYQGEYKGNIIWQPLFLNSSDQKSSDRNKEMYARIFVLCGQQIPKLEPMQHELSLLENKLCGLKITQSTYTDRDGNLREKNNIVEVHSSVGFKEELGVMIEPKAAKSKSQSRLGSVIDELNPPFIDSEIPF